MTCFVANAAFVARHVGNRGDLDEVLAKKRDEDDKEQKAHCQRKAETRRAVTTLFRDLPRGCWLELRLHASAGLVGLVQEEGNCASAS